MIDSSSYTIRKALESDIDAILSVMEAAVAVLPSPAWYVPDDRAFLVQHINGHGFTLVAVREEVIVAFLVVRFPGTEADNLGTYLNPDADGARRVAHMESVAGRPCECGHGLQRKLLEAAEAILAPTDYLHWMATVHPDNRYSLANFQCLGYREVTRVKKYGGLDRIILHKINPSFKTN